MRDTCLGDILDIVLKNSDEAVIILDEQLQIQFLSNNVYSFFGIHNDFKIELLSDLVDEKDLIVLISALKNIIKNNKESDEALFRIKSHLATDHFFKAKISPYVDKDEKKGIVVKLYPHKPVYFHSQYQHAVEESEHFYKQILENNSDCITLINADGKIIYQSPSVERTLGYNKEELLGHHFLHYVMEDVSENLSELFEAFKQQPNAVVKRTLCYRHKTNGCVWMEGTVFNLLDDPAVQAVVANFKDITAHKNAQEELLRSQAHFLAILNHTDMGYILVDTDFRIVAFNQTAQHYLTASGSQVLEKGRNIIGYYNKNQQEIIRRFKTVLSGKRIKYEISYKDKNRELKWYSVSLFPTTDDTGNIYGIVMSFNEITSKKQQQDALKQNEERYRELFETAPEAILLLDAATNKFTYFNSKALSMFKYSAEAMFTINPFVLFPLYQPDQQLSVEKAKMIFYNIERSGASEKVLEWNYVDANGETLVTEVRLSRLVHHSQTLLRISIIDISERKAIEAEKRKMLEEIINRNRDLELFTYMVSHNLRAPVANIIGLSNLLTEEKEEHRKMPLINMIGTAANHLDDVVKDLNTILSIRTHLHEKYETIHLPELINHLKTHIADFSATEAFLQTDFSVSTITACKSYMYSIFYNLITNSIKYRKEKEVPTISIKAGVKQNFIEITYTDTSKGIDMDRFGKQVFGLYKRFDTSVSGKGMGLFLVKTKVENMGGKISLQSKPGQGCTFSILLPHTNE